MPEADAVRPVLAVDGECRIKHVFEDAKLVWSGGSIEIGDHYGDPNCGLVNTCVGWCATGGEGLVICHFDGGLPKGTARSAEKRLKKSELWRRSSPPPSGAYWSVEGMWFYRDDLIRVVVEPVSEHAGLYEVDVRTLAWRKL